MPGKPATWAGAEFYFEKIRDRQVWDFPLVNIAAAMKVSGGKIDGIRLAVNGVAAHPVHLVQVEAAVQGKQRNAETADMAGRWPSRAPSRSSTTATKSR